MTLYLPECKEHKYIRFACRMCDDGTVRLVLLWPIWNLSIARAAADENECARGSSQCVDIRLTGECVLCVVDGLFFSLPLSFSSSSLSLLSTSFVLCHAVCYCRIWICQNLCIDWSIHLAFVWVLSNRWQHRSHKFLFFHNFSFFVEVTDAIQFRFSSKNSIHRRNDNYPKTNFNH